MENIKIKGARLAKINAYSQAAFFALSKIRNEIDVLNDRSQLKIIASDEREIISKTMLLMEQLDRDTDIHVIDKQLS
jgi:hypothetical protein